MSSGEPNFVMVAGEDPSPSVERLRRQALRLLHQGGEDLHEDDYAGARAGEAPPRSYDDTPVAAPPAQSMMVGIITMPAVFFVVVLGALALFGAPAAVKPVETASASLSATDSLSQPAKARAAEPVFASALTGQPLAISLTDDQRIRSIALDGDRVALHVEGPEGQEILVYDFLQGRVIAEAPIKTASLDAVDALASLTGPPPAAVKSAPLEPTIVESLAPAADAPAAIPRAPILKPRGDS
jgi:hypothetical protein